MARRKSLSDIGVTNLKARASRYVESDPELPGHYIRVQPSGAKSYVAVARNPKGKQVWHTVGATSLFGVAEAREKAREAIKAIKAGEDRAPPESFEAVAAEWFKRHVLAKGLRSRSEIERFVKHICRAWHGRDFNTIRRGEVAKLLDTMEDKHGARQADYALAVIRQIANWYATRHENYQSPIVKGMRRTNPKEQARARILDDDEIRAVWKQAEANGLFGAFVRLLLLTAQRRNKVAAMRWQDVSIDGEWRIPAEAREKGNGGEMVLPESVLEIIRAQPRFANNSFVFAGRGGAHFNSYSKSKAAFDAKVKIAPSPQNSTVANEPRWRASRHCRAGHGPRHCWR
jgi:integrase